MSQDTQVELTIATTARNEFGNLPEFFRQCSTAVALLGVRTELIFIDDGSVDDTAKEVLKAQEHYPELNIHLIQNKMSRGITHAILTIAELAVGEWICLIPADLESFPKDDIPALFEARQTDIDVIAGWRQGREDGKSFSSKIYNRINRRWFGVYLHDANWIKLVRREALRDLPLKKNWHRFLTAFFVKQGRSIVEVPVQWHARSYGQSKFTPWRLPGALFDLINVKIFLDFGQRPLAPFVVLTLISLMLAITNAVFALIFLDAQSGQLGLGIMLSAALIIFGLSAMGIGMVVDKRYLRRRHRRNESANIRGES